MSWFNVDKRGLAAVLERRGKAFAFYELVQNAWDAGASRVDVRFGVPARGRVNFVVEDDSPTGFVDLDAAYTLFGKSTSAADPEKRGRFCIGDKLVLALCAEASIVTTTGVVIFNVDGTRTVHRERRLDRGTRVIGSMRLTRTELAEVRGALGRLLPPVPTFVDDVEVLLREPLVGFEATLPTEWADDEGVLRRRTRECMVHVYEPLDSEPGWLYELGIPVVETGDRYHVEVGQKVPLNSDRDNVTPGYLRTLRTLVLNQTAHNLNPEEAAAPWVREAAAGEGVTPRALEAVMTARFGPRRVVADPSDPEGTKMAVAAGYTVVTGGALSAGEWANVREHGTMLPAGQVTPSPRPYGPDGLTLHEVPVEAWTDDQVRVTDYARRAARALLGVGDLDVKLVSHRSWMAAATYGRGCPLVLNVAKLQPAWWGSWPNVTELLLHEFGHHYCGDHLSERYHEALCALGVKLAQWVYANPEEATL